MSSIGVLNSANSSLGILATSHGWSQVVAVRLAVELHGGPCAQEVVGGQSVRSAMGGLSKLDGCLRWQEEVAFQESR